MRDWTKTLPNASFRGRPFFIEREEVGNAGRRIAEHEFAKSDDHSTEDTGRKTRRLKFSAYIVGDTADSDARDFVEMCSMPGVGTLRLPVLGTYSVRCTNCDASAEKGRMGYVAVSMDFIEAGNDSAFSVSALGDRIAASLMGGMGAAIQSTLSGFAR